MFWIQVLTVELHRHLQALTVHLHQRIKWLFKVLGTAFVLWTRKNNMDPMVIPSQHLWIEVQHRHLMSQSLPHLVKYLLFPFLVMLLCFVEDLLPVEYLLPQAFTGDPSPQVLMGGPLLRTLVGGPLLRTLTGDPPYQVLGAVLF